MLLRTKLLSYFCRRDRGWLLSLLVAVCLVYLPFLGNPFVFDDISFFLGGSAKNYANTGFPFPMRWLPYASLGSVLAVFGDALPHIYHLVSMLVHAASVFLLFYLSRKLIAAAIPESKGSPAIIWGSWFAALIFACHPVAVYAVGYVAQISILMATFFGLLMYWAYIRGMLSGEKRWLVLSVVAYSFACFSKEHSALLPLALAALALILRGCSQLDRRALWLTWSAYVLVFVLLISIVKGVFGSVYEPMAAQMFEQQSIVESTQMLHLQSVMTQAGLFFKYLLLFIFPNPAWMSVDMREQFVTNWWSWQGIAGITAFVTYGIFALRLLTRGGVRGLLGFALLYPWLLFLIEFSSIRVQESFVLYRAYLWLPGLTLLVPLLLLKMPGRRTLIVLGLAIMLLLPVAWNRLTTFSDNYKLWNDAALLLSDDKVAGADRIFFNRGQAEIKAKRWAEAEADFMRALAIRSDLAPFHSELGKVYLNLGKFEKSVAQFDASIAISPGESYSYLGKGLALMRMHDYVNSQQVLKKACEMGEQAGCLVAALLNEKS